MIQPFPVLNWSTINSFANLPGDKQHLEGRIAEMRQNRNMNLVYTLLSIWLIVWGLITLLALNFPFQNVVLGLLAIAVGILILINR